jgi:hypothetical protein
MFAKPLRSLSLLALSVPMAAFAQEPKSESPPAAPMRSELRDRQLDVALEARDIERILARLKRASELSKTRITEAATVSENVSAALDRGDSPAARKDAEQAAAMFQEIAKLLEALLAEETPQRVAAARNMAARLSRTERQFAQQIRAMQNPPTPNGGAGGNPPPMPKEGDRPPRGQGKSPMTEPRDGQGSGQPKESSSKDEPSPGTGGGKTPMPKDDASKPGGDGDQTPEADGQKPGGSGADQTEPKPDTPVNGGGASDKPPETESPKGTGGGGPRKPMTEEERRAALAKRATELAESGETLLDILKAIAESTEPADRDAVAKVQSLLNETKLAEAVAAMQQAGDQVADRKLDDARLAALDVADRLEIAAQRLDAAYRTIVAPQAEELRKLEQQLAQMMEKLNDLQTQAQVAAWHRELRDLLDRAEELGVQKVTLEQLIEELSKSGLGPGGDRTAVNWGIVDGRFAPPAEYAVKLLDLQEEIQSRIQGLLLGDVVSAADDATPPKYQGLVDRYYEVLSREGRSDPTANAMRKPSPPAVKGGTP